MRKKENPHLVHILSYSETSPKERGECSDGKREKMTSDERRMTKEM